MYHGAGNGHKEESWSKQDFCQLYLSCGSRGFCLHMGAFCGKLNAINWGILIKVFLFEPQSDKLLIL